MSERHYAKSIEGIKAILESIKPVDGKCYNNYGYSTKFLPKYRIKETSDGFEIEVWYVCSSCGAVR